jgi:hypothetical protein
MTRLAISVLRGSLKLDVPSAQLPPSLPERPADINRNNPTRRQSCGRSRGLQRYIRSGAEIPSSPSVAASVWRVT